MTDTVSETTHALTISAEDLLAALERVDDVVVLDVRSQGSVEDLHAEYDRGHIPGARFVHLASQLAGPRTEGSGNNPLPSQDQLQRLVRDLGINRDSTVVVYSPDRPPFATRAWWVLRWGGLSDVRYLDGGLAAWAGAGGELTTEVPQFAPGDAVVTVGALESIDTHEVAQVAADGLLLDARPASSYVGVTTENGDPVDGHIPGAISRPSGLNLRPDGTLKSEDELRVLYADAIAADGPVAVYCGGGVGATLDLLALSAIGVDAKLYPGSFSAWSSDPDRPVVRGDRPHA